MRAWERGTTSCKLLTIVNYQGSVQLQVNQVANVCFAMPRLAAGVLTTEAENFFQYFTNLTKTAHPPAAVGCILEYLVGVPS